MNYQIFRHLLHVLGAVFIIGSTNFLHADTLRTQTIALHPGWNSVFLQVAPINPNPAIIFSNTPVTMASAYFGNGSSVQFVQNPGGISWKHDGWSVWYGSSRPDSFLSTLTAINGNQAYLIFSESDFTWNVSGKVTLQPTVWKPDSYNFSGFGVSSVAPPTFAKFFAGSPAHQPGKVYRLLNNQWTLIANTTNTPMAAGEACWVYCRGASDYQGPITIKPSSGDTISFGSTAESPVMLENRTVDPVAVKVETISGADAVPLGYVVRGITTGKMTDIMFDLPSQYSPPALEAKQTSWLWLALKREKLAKATQSSLLKISTDSGAEVWVPVTGTRVP
ncbi:MAG: hypothetical protein RL616_2219 [Verrucomicrobiota bacterium]